MLETPAIIEGIINEFIKKMKEFGRFEDVTDDKYYLHKTQMPDPPNFPVISFDVKKRPIPKHLEADGRDCSNITTKEFSILFLTSPSQGKDLAIRQHLRFDEAIDEFLELYPPDEKIHDSILEFEPTSGGSVKVKNPNVEKSSNKQDNIYANMTILNFRMSYVL